MPTTSAVPSLIPSNQSSVPSLNMLPPSNSTFSLFSNTNNINREEEETNPRKRSNDLCEDIICSTITNNDEQFFKKAKTQPTTTTNGKWRLEILPAQVLYQIMTFINRVELIKSVGKVSRHFHRT